MPVSAIRTHLLSNVGVLSFRSSQNARRVSPDPRNVFADRQMHLARGIHQRLWSIRATTVVVTDDYDSFTSRRVRSISAVPCGHSHLASACPHDLQSDFRLLYTNPRARAHVDVPQSPSLLRLPWLLDLCNCRLGRTMAGTILSFVFHELIPHMKWSILRWDDAGPAVDREELAGWTAPAGYFRP